MFKKIAMHDVMLGLSLLVLGAFICNPSFMLSARVKSNIEDIQEVAKEIAVNENLDVDQTLVRLNDLETYSTHLGVEATSSNPMIQDEVRQSLDAIYQLKDKLQNRNKIEK